MPAKIDETGNRYGKLLVIEEAGSNKQGVMWKCVCICGNETTVNGCSLRNSHTKSCGCPRKGKENSNYRHGLARTKGYFCAMAQKRHTMKLNQRPDTANQEEINKFYIISDKLNDIGWAQYEVDHIEGLFIGGLDYENNLQILERGKNRSKPRTRCLTKKEESHYKGITLVDMKNHPEIFDIVINGKSKEVLNGK